MRQAMPIITRKTAITGCRRKAAKSSSQSGPASRRRSMPYWLHRAGMPSTTSPAGLLLVDDAVEVAQLGVLVHDDLGAAQRQEGGGVGGALGDVGDGHDGQVAVVVLEGAEELGQVAGHDRVAAAAFELQDDQV